MGGFTSDAVRAESEDRLLRVVTNHCHRASIDCCHTTHI